MWSISFNNGMERRWHFKAGRSLRNQGEMQTGEEVRDRRERWAGGKQGKEDHRSLMKNLQWQRRMRGFRKHLHFLQVFGQFLLQQGEKSRVSARLENLKTPGGMWGWFYSYSDFTDEGGEAQRSWPDPTVAHLPNGRVEICTMCLMLTPVFLSTLLKTIRQRVNESYFHIKKYK